MLARRLLFLFLLLTACSKATDGTHQPPPSLGGELKPLSSLAQDPKTPHESPAAEKQATPTPIKPPVRWSVEPRPSNDPRSCAEGDLVECILDAQFAFRNQDWDRAIGLYRRACTAQTETPQIKLSPRQRFAIETGCGRLVLLPLEFEQSSPMFDKTVKVAHQVLAEACDRTINLACSTMRLRKSSPYLFSEDEISTFNANKLAMLEASCNAGNMHDCAVFATLLREEDGRPNAISRARKILRSNCEKGVQYSCYLETGYYFRGDGGVTVDHAKGHELLNDSCENGAPWSCDVLARLHRDGGGVPASHEKHFEYLVKSCNLFHWNSCEKASEGPRELLEKLGAYIVESPAENAAVDDKSVNDTPVPAQ